ncbi:WhiB family transcriptional regulator [Intrasporangium chromatireducens Q5-1]|uniref:WhiB family transcriptional regulator n=1 Tax=Intrasporangium chromatireducens Q5-1 TaxID=584657 RepID=W9GNL4_9MICO|nr:WhiB family transcriptional regulator [Intrasporangium chromatireducens]EWT06662.1 WhiB family transcriptional regulator [Intrasporangium chromatireducens Q5-1]
MTGATAIERDGYGTPQRWVDRTGGPTLDELHASRWHHRAACRDWPAYLWTDDYTHAQTSPAIPICEECPVRGACLASALVYGDEYGIYGGTTASERARLTRRLRHGETLGAVLAAVLGSPERASSRADRGAA